MNAARSFRQLVLALGCLSASNALAIPTITSCSSYWSWSSGVISTADIAYENTPHPVSLDSANASATSRCYGLWMQRGGNPLTYANAGNMAQVWQTSSTSYQYQCLICSGARPPGKLWLNIDAAVAVQMAHSKLDGQVLAVDPKVRVDGDQVAVNYEVSIMRGDHLTRVFVDGQSGEILVPEVTTGVTLYPDNICK